MSSEWSLAYIWEELMSPEDYVRKVFKGIEQGDGTSFFEHKTTDRSNAVKQRLRRCLNFGA